jgi:hypothetical protein
VSGGEHGIPFRLVYHESGEQLAEAQGSVQKRRDGFYFQSKGNQERRAPIQGIDI